MLRINLLMPAVDDKSAEAQRRRSRAGVDLTHEFPKRWALYLYGWVTIHGGGRTTKVLKLDIFQGSNADTPGRARKVWRWVEEETITSIMAKALRGEMADAEDAGRCKHGNSVPDPGCGCGV